MIECRIWHIDAWFWTIMKYIKCYNCYSIAWYKSWKPLLKKRLSMQISTVPQNFWIYRTTVKLLGQLIDPLSGGARGQILPMPLSTGSGGSNFTLVWQILIILIAFQVLMDKACFCPPKGSRDWGGVGCKLKLCQCRNVAPQTGVAKPDPCHTTLHFKLVWQSPHKPHHFRRQWPRGEGEGGGGLAGPRVGDFIVGTSPWGAKTLARISSIKVQSAFASFQW